MKRHQKFLVSVVLSLLFIASPLGAVVPTPTGQKMIEESNKIYSGNKYNMTPEKYNQWRNYNSEWGQYYYPNYYSYPGSYYNYSNYYYNPYGSYYNNPYGNYYNPYGYDNYYNYSGSSFPDADRADALYRYIQSR